MKLVNAKMPNHKFATSNGVVESDASGRMEVSDPAFAAVMLKTGWKEEGKGRLTAKAPEPAKADVEAEEEPEAEEEAEEVSEEVEEAPAPVAPETLKAKGKDGKDSPKWMRSR